MPKATTLAVVITGDKMRFYILLILLISTFSNANEVDKLKREKDLYWDSIAPIRAEKCPESSSDECLFEINLENAVGGNRIAMYLVGYQYSRGEGVTKSLSKAHIWYERSAKKGYYVAQVETAIDYGQAYGVSVDLERYVYWLEKAARQNIGPEPQLWLGVSYLYGSGVAQDNKKALYWFEQTLTLASMESSWRAEALYYIGRMIEAGETETPKEEAVNYFKEAASMGHPGAKKWYLKVSNNND